MKMPSNGNIAAASSAPLIIDSSAIIYSSDNYNNNINKSPTSTSINEINSNSYNLGAKSLQQQAGPHGQNKSNGSIDMKQPQPTHNAHHHRRNKSSVDILGCSEFGHVRKGYYQDVPVAVKTLNLPTEVDPLVSIEIFIYEAKKLKEFNHARIVNFIGFIVDTCKSSQTL